MGESIVTDEMRALIGRPGPTRVAPDPISRDELRRFAQATLDPDELHWDTAKARAAGYPDVVAPPLYPVHAVRRTPGTPDPLARAGREPDWDGAEADALWRGLPELDIPLHRHLNGGSEVEFFSLTSAGEQVEETSRYVAIDEKQGRSGALVLTTVETEYRTTGGRPLATVRMTVVRR
ncbi:MAG TPA: MaoC family dehydratase N-terminal domain-containing protein [Micromonosporaceae bacterium]